MQYDGAGRVPERLRLWSLSEDVLVETGHGGDTLVAFTRWGEIRIEDGSVAVREALSRMSLGPVAVVNLPRDEDGGGAAPGRPGRNETGAGATRQCRQCSGGGGGGGGLPRPCGPD